MASNAAPAKGPRTGCYDADGNELHVGQKVLFLGRSGMVVFNAGAYGIAFDDPIDWTAVKREAEPTSSYLNRLNACMNDHFISFWEIIWNFNGEDNAMPCVELAEGES